LFSLQQLEFVKDFITEIADSSSSKTFISIFKIFIITTQHETDHTVIFYHDIIASMVFPGTDVGTFPLS